MGFFTAVLLGIIEGITEFLPVSSTAHLTIVEKLLGYNIEHPDIVAFTAIIQTGAILAAVIYFRDDIIRIVAAWFKGLFNKEARGLDYRMGWAVIVGTIPIAVIGLLFKDQIERDVRSLWLVAGALILWSGVMWLADRADKARRHEKDITWRDTLFVGLFQCLALVPGVSRSGATISAGLFRGLDRVAVTRLSFFLAIPALLAAAGLETVTKSSQIADGVGWTATLAATVAAFLSAYFAIAWLLRFVSKHNFTAFIIYRVALGLLLIVLLAAGTIAAT
jgi:undecaprenyl-diphosphatase